MAAKWPLSQQPKGAKLDNDAHHGRRDPNGGGSPTITNRKMVPDASKGGAYQSGVKQYANTSIHGGRSGTGNPASRGGMSSVGRQSFPSESRIPGHGGAPQVRDNLDTVSGRGGFGNDGTAGLPSYGPSNPQPGAGNLSGKMATRIVGRFNNKSKGANATGVVGSYGRNAITSNT
jgi:hypothetical protein